MCAEPSLVSALLPDAVVCVETDRLGDASDLHPEEEALVARAVDKRRREFAAVRRCARAALDRLGVPAGPILPGARGAPQWPVGVVGSMTHCAGYVAAAVARADRIRAVGIDVEPHGPLPAGVLRVVARPEEAARVAALTARRPDVPWDRLLFSAKESVYKAWFPLTGSWLDFDGARVTMSDTGDLAVELLVPGPMVDGRRITAFQGRWRATSELVATAIVVPAAS